MSLTLICIVPLGDANPAQILIVVHRFLRHTIIKCWEGRGPLTASGDSPVPQALEVAGAGGGEDMMNSTNLRSKPNWARPVKVPGTMMSGANRIRKSLWDFGRTLQAWDAFGSSRSNFVRPSIQSGALGFSNAPGCRIQVERGNPRRVLGFAKKVR